jgi:serine/threonine protein kinase
MGSKGSKAAAKPADWVMPPTAPFLDKPVELGPYWLLSSLGKGAFGEALLAVRKRDIGEVKEPTCESLYRAPAPKWVVKRFNDATKASQESAAADHVRAELGAAHPNLLQFDRHFEDKENKSSALVFEYCNAGDLRRLVRKRQERKQQLSLAEVLTIGTQLCGALCALKKAKILHGDVALRNVFLQWNPDTRALTVKLGDFGLCRDLGDSKTVTGRDVYSAHMAPEIVDDDAPYNEQVDVYACGVVLYELMSLVVVHVTTKLLLIPGQVDAERKEIEKQLLADDLKQRYQELRTLVHDMLQRDPAKRPSIEDVSARLAAMLGALPGSGA